MSAPALSIENLAYRYNDHAAVLCGINLLVEDGCLFGLLGPNGAGKTTTLGIIAHQLHGYSGTVSHFGQQLAKADASLMSLVPQEYAFYQRMSVAENLGFFAKVQGIRGADVTDRIAAVLDRCELTEQARMRSAHLSGGQKRRLNLAIGLLSRPKILLLDEPTVGIDPQSRRHILDTIKAVNRSGTTVIYTSHYMEEVDYLCERIAIVDAGKVVAEGSGAQLLELHSSDGLEELFLSLTNKALRD